MEKNKRNVANSKEYKKNEANGQGNRKNVFSVKENKRDVASDKENKKNVASGKDVAGVGKKKRVDDAHKEEEVQAFFGKRARKDKNQSVVHQKKIKHSSLF